MKILMVNKFLYPRGGSESYMLKLSEELKSQGHEVEYFGMYDAQNTVGNSLGLYTQNMDFHSTGAARFLYPFKIIYASITGSLSNKPLLLIRIFFLFTILASMFSIQFSFASFHALTVSNLNFFPASSLAM